MKKKVILRGPFCTKSGYGQHARMIARYALNRSDWDCSFLLTPWGNTPWSLDLNDSLNKQIMDRSVAEPVFSDLSVQVQLPNEWSSLACKNIGVTAGVETDKCNPSWIANINSMDAVIVPSTFVKNTFAATGALTKPVYVVPESFHDACIDPQLSKLKFDTNFNFLIFGQITGNHQLNDRKNTFSAIKWICESFKNDPTVGIVVKTNMGRNSCIDRQMIMNLFMQLIAEVRPQSHFPKIHLLHGDMSDSEIASLYTHPDVKALVAPSRGEGYGLPILEAAAAGLPVIATNWSGHLDFLSSGKFIPLDYTLQPVHQSRIDNAIFMPNVRWAEVDESNFKQKIVKFKNNSTIPKQWAADLRTKLLKTHSFEAIVPTYDRVFASII